MDKIYIAFFIFCSSVVLLTAEKGQPEKPTDFSYVNVTSTSATLRWTAGYDGGARQYFMISKLVQSGVYSQASDRIYDDSNNHGIGENFTYEITNLTPSTWYKFMLAASNDNATYIYADNRVELWTTGPPRPPTNLTVLDISNSSARINWTSGYDGGSKQHFIVYKWNDEGKYVQISDFIYDESSRHDTNGSFTYVVKNLTPSTNYKIMVASENSISYRLVFSETLDFWTNGPPQKPKNLYFTDLAQTSVVIHWTSGYNGGSPQSFMVYKWTHGTEYTQFSERVYDNSHTNGVGKMFSCNLNNLLPDTDYRLIVVAVNSHDQISMSDSDLEIHTMKEEPPNPPINLAVSDITNSSAMLHWTSGYDGGSQQHFIIFKRRADTGLYIEFSEFIFDNGGNGRFKYNIDRLHPSTYYQLKVAAANNFNDSKVFSKTSVDFWTNGPPQKPKEIYISDLTSSSAEIHWTSGYDGGSPQRFMVFRKSSGNDYIQISNPVNDHSGSHGVGEKFSQKLDGLQPDTDYRLKVLADNTVWNPSMSDSYVDFTTRAKGSDSMKIIIGSTAGGLAFIGLLALVVYVLKYRQMRTSYITMKEGDSKKKVTRNDPDTVVVGDIIAKSSLE